MTKRQVVTFQRVVYAHFEAYGRDLPWRRTRNPYRILVSEVMLQQTQVDRVVPKYSAFLRKFPSVRSLAEAPLADVLKEWQGLGYNRRAKSLHVCAKSVMADYRGRFPKEYRALVALPGIGPYTAGAILAFAYNISVPVIETNIRAVYLHHFFPEQTGVADRELMLLIEATLDYENPRQWYAALMDYGAHLKRTEGSQNARSRHYTKQPRFAGSDREIRGAILRALAGSDVPVTATALKKQLPHDPARIESQLAALMGEGLVSRMGRGHLLG